MQLELLSKTTKKSWFQPPKYKKPPVLLNHYTLKPKTDNIKNAIAGEYTQKSFKRLFWDRPSFTACYGNNEVHIHPELHRRLTVREAARIQSFPDYWTLLGGLTTEFKQIGNAVPPYLGKAVIDSVLKNLSIENKNAISLFSGIGGLDIGAELAGLNVVSALEWDNNCVRGLKLNKEIGRRTKVHSFLQHTSIIQADLSKKENTTKAFIEGHYGKKLPKIEVVLGGPPCQAFSSAGSRKGLSDERGQLYLGYLNILKSFNPHTFIFENVIGLKTMNEGQVLEVIKKDFKRLGYNLTVVHLDAVNFSIPQHRNRVFLIGTYDEPYVLNTIERELKSVQMNDKVVSDILRGMPHARLSPSNHDYDEYYYSEECKNAWDIGEAVFKEEQAQMKLP